MRNKLLFVIIVLFILLTGCTHNDTINTKQLMKIRVGVVGEKNDQWEYLKKELLEKENLELEIVKFTDYRAPIVALEDKSIDMHAALTEVYMETINKEAGFSNTVIGYTTLNPMGVYSKKLTAIQELAEGSVVAIPNEPSNEGRALLLLQEANLIKLDASKGLLPTIYDITNNLRDLKFVSMDSNQTAVTMDDTDIALVNNNVASDAGLVPTKDAIYLEKTSEQYKPYYNVIAVRKSEEENTTYKKIVKYYQSEEVAKIINQMSNGSSIPVWDN
ncbi:methionine ABC transporter substrate-binding protein [Enterococcus ureilyticus]|uniref:Lipoprotein n=1 Tax=Enterococcus ureilyticus TaxID=1131292 RepID=A0A1E5HC28_9ENTE|nr:MetQ/NlpA family ABC transporter substrate-binding protein [Enterococcus ureilyticus]MBM7690417.1 D-methionine transport system substrate-binding protein [Enterococcus ureilyticus]OEG22512.1 methionine ABC transporter substrate-binding protein [Enterococcus ureilyticus]